MKSQTATLNQMKKDAREIFQAGVDAVDPVTAVNQHCRRQGDTFWVGDATVDLNRYRHVFLIGAGKAAASMLSAIEALLGDFRTDGAAVVKYGHTQPPVRTRLIEAGHPLPDENGVTAAQAILQIVRKADVEDLVICVLSGGGSALLSLPAPPITLAEKQDTVQVLLACGATIHQVNTIRKHLSAIKGGRLAGAAEPASLISLILSDVVGDDLDVIASGPTVPDAATFGDCLDIIQTYGIQDRLPRSVREHLNKGASGDIPETPKPGNPLFARTRNRIVGNNTAAIQVAREKAQALGYSTMILSSMIEGETREVARVHTAIAKEIRKTGHPLQPPACVLSGGETTVTLTGNGKGGRNQEFALAAALEIDGLGNTVIFSGGTDGTDGPTDAAGAVADATTLERSKAKNLNARRFLRNNDAYNFFQALDDLVITGPTRTNVMDLRIILMR